MDRLARLEATLFSEKASERRRRQAYAQILNLVTAAWRERVAQLEGMLEGDTGT